MKKKKSKISGEAFPITSDPVKKRKIKESIDDIKSLKFIIFLYLPDNGQNHVRPLKSLLFLHFL